MNFDIDAIYYFATTSKATNTDITTAVFHCPFLLLIGGVFLFVLFGFFYWKTRRIIINKDVNV